MYQLEAHKNIQRFTEFLYQAGFWARHDKDTVRERRLKLFYSIYFSLLPILIATGAFESDSKDEKIFSVFLILTAVVIQVKLLYLIWKKNEILEHLGRICDYGSADRETHTAVNDKSTTFKNLVALFLSASYFTLSSVLFVAPFVGTERKLFFHYGFPLDWRKSEFAYWTGFMFTVSVGIIVAVMIAFTALIWYLMANCSWRYEVLGFEIRKMGEISSDESADVRYISKIEKDNLYSRDLVEAITSFNSLREYK